ncbi:hypothetical protein FGO68_gene13390 [Halteria grandinella]|uniref:Uncharacterized protein n=1 Tax=Halteria grandinella TaxID=5974 RepID=A0A8J8SUB7_HALGN|nr:hypothetical protein FGO68_gene13390 [Halteria grandinella]
MNALQTAKKAMEYDDEISEHDESHSEDETPKPHGGFQIINEYSYQKLPVIQEIKVICLHFGAIVHDVLQENHQQSKRFIHVLKFPY